MGVLSLTHTITLGESRRCSESFKELASPLVLADVVENDAGEKGRDERSHAQSLPSDILGTLSEIDSLLLVDRKPNLLVSLSSLRQVEKRRMGQCPCRVLSGRRACGRTAASSSVASAGSTLPPGRAVSPE